MRFLLLEYPTEQGMKGKTRLRKGKKFTVLLSPRSGHTNICNSPSKDPAFVIASCTHSPGASPDHEYRSYINPLIHSPSSPQHLILSCHASCLHPSVRQRILQGSGPHQHRPFHRRRVGRRFFRDIHRVRYSALLNNPLSHQTRSPSFFAESSTHRQENP